MEAVTASRVSEAKEIATLGGGCFWCLEAVYVGLRGVESAVSGYMGGAKANPTYEAVCRGDTGHAEVVQVTFDPAMVESSWRAPSMPPIQTSGTFLRSFSCTTQSRPMVAKERPITPNVISAGRNQKLERSASQKLMNFAFIGV